MTAIVRKIEPIDVDVDELDVSKVLFVGMGATAVAWYRCILPALFLGADWVGLSGEPPSVVFHTGVVKGQTQMPDFNDYEVVVIQQPRGRAWLKVIRGLQARGIKVVYEVDDYLHAIRKMQDHDFRRSFGKGDLSELELCMRVADALTTSTAYIAQRYRSFNRNTYVCENGVDLGRYALTRPPRSTVNIGWAGATGHSKAFQRWAGEVSKVLADNDHTTFVSVGMDFAAAFAQRYGRERALSVPFTMVDNYPAAMTLFDVALAPAGPGNFFRGKSDLRFVEAGALGIPTIADPHVYPHIDHGSTGFHAPGAEDVEVLLDELVNDADLRTRVGEAAREYVRTARDMKVIARRWVEVLGDIRRS